MRRFLTNINKPDLSDKSILITGGTGSFGQKMMRRLIRDFNPRRVAVYSRGEHPHVEIMNSLNAAEMKVFRSFIGDVRDQERLKMAMRGVDIVIHAAALKHVPIAEYNPFECIGTNIIGAENVARAAIDSGVQQVIALSTDKACDPINLYGATKLASDKIFVAANSYAGQSGTRMCVVRYGNVVGSQGSVVPLFQQMVADGVESIPITDEKMTRFWITLDQAVDFVLSSMSLMRGGEIFVPKIPSMNVMDLKEAIAPGIPHEIIGKRPGEKMHEVMISQHVSHNVVDMHDRYAIEPEWSFWERESFDSEKYTKVSEDFTYASDNNAEWLSVDQLRSLLAV